jgi:hypothetical protein
MGPVMDHPVVERDVMDGAMMYDMRRPAGRRRHGGHGGHANNRHRDGERDKEGGDFRGHVIAPGQSE